MSTQTDEIEVRDEELEEVSGFHRVRMGTLQIVLRGLTPLLMHDPKGMVPGSSKSSGLGKKKIPTPKEEAEQGAYRLPNNDLAVPTVAVRASILNGAKGLRIGKTAAKPQIAAALMPMGDQLFPLFRSEAPITEYNIDTRRVMVQRAGIMRSRAEIVIPWQVVATFQYNPVVSAEAILQAASNAGRLAGLLDYRPEKSGWYGMYEVEALEATGAVDMEGDSMDFEYHIDE